MVDFPDWSPTQASNADVDGLVLGTGMATADVNNSLQAIMANVAVIRNMLGGAVTTGGSANAQTLTSGITAPAYAQGILWGFEAGYTNTGTTTLAIDGLTAKTIKTPTGANLSAGMITAGGIYHVAYEAGADVLILINAAILTAAGLGLGTSDSPQFTAVNIGHATDTTLARVSAGVLSVEGVTIATRTGTETLTNKTLTAPVVNSPTGIAQADISGLTTASSPQFTAVNIGHASDTTLARVSAGVASIEGSNILVASAVGVTVAPIPTSSTYPVGFSTYLYYTSTTAVADGATTAGTNLVSIPAFFNAPLNGYVFENGGGATQTGTWMNISGATQDNNGTYAVGLWVRTA